MAAKVKTQKTQKKEKKEKKTKTRKSGKESSAAKAGYPWLLADARAVDQNLASLFAHVRAERRRFVAPWRWWGSC